MGSAPVDPALLARAVRRAVRVLAQSQRPDGSWDRPGYVGPWLTAQGLIVLRFFGRLSADDAAGMSRWLRTQQLPDGSFGVRPFARTGDLGTTATVWAALVAAHDAESGPSAQRARAWVQAHGGDAALVAGVERGDLSALFVSLAGLLDAKTLPCPHTEPLLLPLVLRTLETRFNVGVFQTAVGMEAVVKRLRGDWGADGRSKGILGAMTCRQLVGLLETFHNPDGSWNDSSVITVLALAVLAGAAPYGEAMRERGVAWLEKQKVVDPHGVHFDGFSTEVWSTAFDVRAWMVAGVAATQPGPHRALEWLARAQCRVPMPRVNNRQAAAPKEGGWAFQRTNVTMPDSDDAAVSLTALGLALRHGPTGVAPQLLGPLRQAADRGRAWLLGMQNPDGGWSAFVWGLPGKKPGPTLQTAPRVKMNDPFSLAQAALDPPASFGDPSTEDVTARALQGLGALGLTERAPQVQRALSFLQKQQCPSGAWWGRWVVNYLSATAFVMRGAAAVGVRADAPWLERAVAWVLARQNDDGGWGEGPESYADEAKAGRGPSTAPLTALVLQGLLDAGQGESDAVRRAVAYLLRTQRADGTWPNGEYLHTNVPPNTFYLYTEPARFYPTEALALYQRAQRGDPAPQPRWSDALLDRMRQHADPLADGVVKEIYAQHDVAEADRVLPTLFRSDEPVPTGLPERARRYFEETDALPVWADAQQIALAQALFTRAGWSVAAGLFCSSLPQAYAAAKGAQVLLQTQGMTHHVRQRIFETAQFLFDVLDVGGLSPGGRGIRAAQKVRLMHAGIRHLVLARARPPWDPAVSGLPVNQEDLAGTLMTFSVVTLDALAGLSVPVSAEEGEAWLHTWKVVGHLLGVDPQVVPDDVFDAHLLMDAIRDRQWAASEGGRALAQALVDLMGSFMPNPLLRGLPAAVIRHLAGDHCADLLGLPQFGWGHLLGAACQVFGALEADGLVQKLLGLWTHALMEAVVKVEREGKEARFRIPASLEDAVDPRF